MFAGTWPAYLVYVLAGMWPAYLVCVLAGMWPAYLVYVLAGMWLVCVLAGMWPAYLVCVAGRACLAVRGAGHTVKNGVLRYTSIGVVEEVLFQHPCLASIFSSKIPVECILTLWTNS